MADLTSACGDLEDWLPALAQALARDNTPAGGQRVLSAGGVVNPDVLHAMETLRRQIPATTRTAAELAGEPWKPRPLPLHLRALPRLHERLEHTGQQQTARNIDSDVAHWTTVTKHALGLRKPDMPVGWNCPLHDDPSPLVLAGADGQLIGQTVTFTVSGLILCRGCGAQWPATQWLMLGRILEEAS